MSVLRCRRLVALVEAGCKIAGGVCWEVVFGVVVRLVASSLEIELVRAVAWRSPGSKLVVWRLCRLGLPYRRVLTSVRGALSGNVNVHARGRIRLIGSW